jgi:hypothetical protein
MKTNSIFQPIREGGFYASALLRAWMLEYWDEASEWFFFRM